MDVQSQNLTIPRGIVLFARYLPGTQNPGPFRDMGNCPEFTLTRANETLPHYSSRGGLKTLDAELTIDSTMSGNLVTDDCKTENVAYYFQNDVTTVTTVAATAQTETFPAVKAGDIFQLGRSDTNPSGYRKVAAVTVNVGAAAKVLGTDYTVDLDLGILEIPVGSTAIGSAIIVTYNVAASTRDRIAAGNQQIEGELRFVSYNPTGLQADTVIPRARISASGDFNLVNSPDSPEFMSLALSISVLKKGNLALAYRDGRPA